MEKVIEITLFFMGSLFISSFYIYSWQTLPQNRKTLSKKRILFLIIITSIILQITSYLFMQPFRLFVVFALLIGINYFLISKSIRYSIVTVIISQMIISFTEFSFAIICSFFFENKIYKLLFQPIPSLIMSIYIFLLSTVIVRKKTIKRIYKLLYNNTKNKENIIFCLIVIFTLVIATVESHMKLPLPLVLITNLIMAIIFIAIIIVSTKIKDSYNKISNKYETSVSSLKEYEVMIDKFKVDTHENRNEFLTIRNMLKGKTKKADVIKYIDKLVDNKIKDNDKIMRKTAKIPSGGLRATIYSKLCLMDKLKIDYTLNISRDVSTTDLIDIDEDLISKICKILGVFLDNSIEAVKGLKKKEIMVDIYKSDNSLCIDIANNFKGNLNLEKINDIKYTTKGEGHGYGLTLVNDILIEEIDKLENEKSINGDTFTQTLKIKNVE